jgi:hypothetical protein
MLYDAAIVDGYLRVVVCWFICSVGRLDEQSPRASQKVPLRSEAVLAILMMASTIEANCQEFLPIFSSMH